MGCSVDLAMVLAELNYKQFKDIFLAKYIILSFGPLNSWAPSHFEVFTPRTYFSNYPLVLPYWASAVTLFFYPQFSFLLISH